MEFEGYSSYWVDDLDQWPTDLKKEMVPLLYAGIHLMKFDGCWSNGTQIIELETFSSKIYDNFDLWSTDTIYSKILPVKYCIFIPWSLKKFFGLNGTQVVEWKHCVTDKTNSMDKQGKQNDSCGDEMTLAVFEQPFLKQHI